MTHRPDYTPEEWKALTEIPTLVGGAVMVAGESGSDTLKEAHALVKALFSGGKDHPDNELVRSVVADRVKAMAVGSMDIAAEYLDDDPAAVLKAAVEQMGYVRTVLDAKSTADEASEFKAWLLEIGQDVAEAAREGGFLKVLGLGGKRVSADEQKALDALRAAAGG